MAIKLADAITYLSADNTQLKKDLGAAEKDTKGWTGAVGTMAGNLMSGIITGGATLALEGVQRLGAGLVSAIGDAMGLENVANTFDNLVQSIGGDTVQAMEQLRESTRGMVADADLMLAGNKFLAMGLADTTEGAAELAEIATQLGSAMGEDATASMENFALMMANQSIPRLDSFGISSGQVRERIKELMDATEGMTREQAFNTAVMEQARVTMQKVGEQGDTAGGAMARIQATIENLRIELASEFLPIAEKVLNWVAEALPVAIDWLKKQWELMQVKFAQFKVVYDTYLKPPLDALWEAFQKLLEALGINEENMGALGETFMEIFSALMAAGFEKWLGDVITFIENLTSTVEAVIEVVNWFKEAWDAVANLDLGILGDVLGIMSPVLGGVMGGAQDNRRNFTNYGGIQNYGGQGSANPLAQLWDMNQ